MIARALSPLAWRLAAAFVVVAVAALGVLLALLLAATRSEVRQLAEDRQAADATATAAAAAEAYAQAGSWADVDLTAAAAIAARGQATLVVRDPGGVVVAAATDEAVRMMAEMHGVDVLDVPRADPVSAPVTVAGDTVGVTHLSFPVQGLPAAEQQVRDSLSRVALVSALLATLVAVGVALFVAARVTGPVVALTDAAAKLEQGHRDVQVGLDKAPGELGQLAAAFDRMAGAVQREDALRRQLVADVAHEVRTPLTILRGYTEGLADGVLPPDHATLSSLHEEVLRLSTLVTDLETLAAADAAGLSLALESVDLADIARAAVELAGPAAAEVGLAIEADLAPAPTTGEPRRLAQVLTNLLANAIRYSPAGGTITVTTGARNGQAVVGVVDTGPGIPDDELPRLFDRFFRGRVAQDRPGSGIGLSVARELVTAHGGTITAANHSQGGAILTVSLPLRVVQAASQERRTG